MSEKELREAALIHAGTPLVDGRRPGSPLLDLIPDDVRPSAEVFALAEEVTGKPVDRTGLSGAMAPEVWAARVRAHLTRWAVKNGGSLEAYRSARHAAAVREFVTFGHPTRH